MNIIRLVNGNYIAWNDYEKIVKAVNKLGHFDKDIIKKIIN